MKNLYIAMAKTEASRDWLEQLGYDQERAYRRHLFEGILVASTPGDLFKGSLIDFLFPANVEYILQEFVLATISYIGGNPEAIAQISKPSDNPASKMASEEFVKRVWACFQEELNAHSGKLDDRVERAIQELVKPRETPLDDPWTLTELYRYLSPIDYNAMGVRFSPGIYTYCLLGIYYPSWIPPLFSLPYALVKWIEHQWLPLLSPSEVRDIIGIGKAMRGYMNRDIKKLIG
ncbi:hypothetical protein DRJ48_02720 [Candidatus Woesearchaeota archaeon]|nr:MAG: hypothetical protein DRJ48_02720 [Candidatus Woesearchaeota archaeon]